MFDVVLDLLASPIAWIWGTIALIVIGAASFLLAPVFSRRQLHRVLATQRPYADSMGRWACRILGLTCIVVAAVDLLVESPLLRAFLGSAVFLAGSSWGWFFLHRRADLERLSLRDEGETW